MYLFSAALSIVPFIAAADVIPLSARLSAGFFFYFLFVISPVICCNEDEDMTGYQRPLFHCPVGPLGLRGCGRSFFYALGLAFRTISAASLSLFCAKRCPLFCAKLKSQGNRDCIPVRAAITDLIKIFAGTEYTQPTCHWIVVGAINVREGIPMGRRPSRFRHLAHSLN